jgi:NAD+ synthase (glutamine-hydrolysing)
VATAVPPVRPGNVDFNISKILSYIEQARDKHVRLLLFPELSVTGYTCGDLFFSDLLLDEAESAVLALEKHSKGIAFAVGAPLRVGSFLCNCAFFYSDGSLVGIVPKTYIPNYCEFSEKRYFTSGASVSESSVKLGGREIPFGTGLVFDFADRLSVGIEICEDLWGPAPPPPSSLSAARIFFSTSRQAPRRRQNANTAVRL